MRYAREIIPADVNKLLQRAKFLDARVCVDVVVDEGKGGGSYFLMLNPWA